LGSIPLVDKTIFLYVVSPDYTHLVPYNTQIHMHVIIIPPILWIRMKILIPTDSNGVYLVMFRYSTVFVIVHRVTFFYRSKETLSVSFSLSLSLALILTLALCILNSEWFFIYSSTVYILFMCSVSILLKKIT
jgi:hypothetical protein